MIYIEGFPGIVFVEGLEHQVRDFIEIIRGLRWQQMTVRGIWTVDDINSMTFPDFLEVDSLSNVARLCKEHNCESIFRYGMKLAGDDV